MSHLRTLVYATGILAASSLANVASATLASYETFSYFGDVSVYDTLSDAQNAVNERSGPHSIPTATNGPRSTLPGARDGSVYVDTATGQFLFLTAWYMTSPDSVGSGTDGFGNPNNTNTGFVQLYDTDGSSLSALSAAWNVAMTEFNIDAAGTNAGATDAARLWPAPFIGGAASLSAGIFHEYDLDFTAVYGAPQPVNSSAAPDDVTGSFTGIFENTSPGDFSGAPVAGFYVFDFSFQRATWAESIAAVALYDGSRGVISAVNVVPAPGTALLMLIGIGALLGKRRSVRV